MSWVTIGVGVLVIILVLLGLFFWSSGAVVIADEEMEDVQKKSPEELAEELVKIKQEDEAEYKMEETDQTYSRG